MEILWYPIRVLLIDLLALELLGLADKLARRSLGLLILIRGKLAAGQVVEEPLVSLFLGARSRLRHASWRLPCSEPRARAPLLFGSQGALVPDDMDRHDDCLIRLLIEILCMYRVGRAEERRSEYYKRSVNVLDT